MVAPISIVDALAHDLPFGCHQISFILTRLKLNLYQWERSNNYINLIFRAWTISSHLLITVVRDLRVFCTPPNPFLIISQARLPRLIHITAIIIMTEVLHWLPITSRIQLHIRSSSWSPNLKLAFTPNISLKLCENLFLEVLHLPSHLALLIFWVILFLVVRLSCMFGCCLTIYTVS